MGPLQKSRSCFLRARRRFPFNSPNRTVPLPRANSRMATCTGTIPIRTCECTAFSVRIAYIAWDTSIMYIISPSVSSEILVLVVNYAHRVMGRISAINAQAAYAGFICTRCCTGVPG